MRDNCIDRSDFNTSRDEKAREKRVNEKGREKGIGSDGNRGRARLYKTLSSAQAKQNRTQLDRRLVFAELCRYPTSTKRTSRPFLYPSTIDNGQKMCKSVEGSVGEPVKYICIYYCSVYIFLYRITRRFD